MRDKYGRWFQSSGPHKVCFDCRVSFKDITICPHCHQPLISVDKKFKPPRRHNVRDWKRLHLLYLARKSWRSASNPRDAKRLLEERWGDNPIDQWSQR